MLTIRKAQIEAMGQAGEERFLSQLTAELQAASPDAVVAPEMLAETVAYARSQGLTQEQHIARLVVAAGSMPVSAMPRDALSILQAYGKDEEEKLAAFERLQAGGDTEPTTAASGFGRAEPGAVVQPCSAGATPPPAEWIEIELVGEDGMGIPWASYEVVLPSGEITAGYLDGSGHARFERLSAPGKCMIRFPELDKEAVSFVESIAARQAKSQ